MKAILTESEFYNAWLKYHNTTIEELIEKEPELMKTVEWYNKYAVTQEQHDEWYEWAIKRLCSYYRCGRKYAQRSFTFNYLNLAPNIVKQ